MTRVIVVGTDVKGAPYGGVAAALPGYIDALSKIGALHEFIPTHGRGGVERYWLRAAAQMPRLARSIRSVRASGEIPVVYAHLGGPLSIGRKAAIMEVARRWGARTLAHIHSPRIDEFLGSRSKRAMFARLLRSADGLCALTPYGKRRLATVFEGPISVVPNPTPPWLIQAAAEAVNTREGPIQALSMARMVPGKGFDAAIRAVARGPGDVSLVIAGDGPERAKLERLVVELGLGERVRFAGWVSGAQKVELLRSSDLFLLPSTMDSFGMGFIEAAAYGVPSIALDWGAIGDVIKDGETGWLCPAGAGAVEHLARALEEASNRDELRRRGDHARQRALSTYSVDEVGRALKRAMDSFVDA